MRTLLARTAVTLFLGLAAACSWWAWMAWDHTDQRDPATGEWHGPYQEWQVIGCGLTLIAVALFGAVRSHPLTVSLMPICFTVAWSRTAAPTDDTGMWLAGAFMLLVGTSAGACLIGGAGALVRSGRQGSDRALR